MSGPKLSAYELEQRRKAELERIQKEISKSRASLIRMQHEASGEVTWCEQQIAQIERQLDLLHSSTLSDAETSTARKAILSYRKDIERQNAMWAEYGKSFDPYINSLAEIQEEEKRAGDKMEHLKQQQEQIGANSLEYHGALRKVAENIKESLACTTLSFAEAMQGINMHKVEVATPQEETASLRDELLRQIANLKSNKLATPRMLTRLERAARFVEEEGRVVVLKEEASRVKDISRDLHRIEEQYELYQNALCEKQSLLAALEDNTVISEEQFEKPEDIESRIEQLVADNKVLQARVIEKTERAEIENSIDSAMRSLGYELIGAKCQHTDGFDKLYLFDDKPGTGIRLIQQANGNIMMKVVGIEHAEAKLDEVHTAYLVEAQKKFCDAYETIIDAFEKQGVRRIKGTEQKRPPSAQFAQAIDVSKYDPEFGNKKDKGLEFDHTESDLNGRTSKRKRTRVQKPVHLTEGG